MLQSYHPSCIDLARLRALKSNMDAPKGWPTPEFGVSVVANSLWLGLVQRGEEMWLSMVQSGYISIDVDMLELWCSTWLAVVRDAFGRWLDVSAVPNETREFLAAISANRPSLHPLRMGPILRTDGNLALIDLAASTHAIEFTLNYPEEHGQTANFRSLHFETAIQGVIDRSPWAPPPTLGQLRGRVLRRSDRDLCDVDAIASRGKQLLLVSAKSIRFGESLERGDFRGVRNAASTVSQACSDAYALANDLRTNLVGSNYDFRGFTDIDVLVCTPFVVYVPIGPATRLLKPNLLAAASLDELETFLTKSDD